MAMGTTSYFEGFNDRMTDSAEHNRTAWSPDRPAMISTTRVFRRSLIVPSYPPRPRRSLLRWQRGPHGDGLPCGHAMRLPAARRRRAVPALPTAGLMAFFLPRF